MSSTGDGDDGGSGDPVCGAPGCGRPVVDNGMLPAKKTKCKQCKVVVHTGHCCSKVWTPFSFSTFCTKDCIKAYNLDHGENYPLARYPPGVNGNRGDRSAADDSGADAVFASSQSDAGAIPSGGAATAEQFWICGACNKEPACALHHMCRSCGKHVHVAILCPVVWMPKEDDYFCGEACLRAFNTATGAGLPIHTAAPRPRTGKNRARLPSKGQPRGHPLPAPVAEPSSTCPATVRRPCSTPPVPRAPSYPLMQLSTPRRPSRPPERLAPPPRRVLSVVWSMPPSPLLWPTPPARMPPPLERPAPLRTGSQPMPTPPPKAMAMRAMAFLSFTVG